jgi:hypothetical protein
MRLLKTAFDFARRPSRLSSLVAEPVTTWVRTLASTWTILTDLRRLFPVAKPSSLSVCFIYSLNQKYDKHSRGFKGGSYRNVEMTVDILRSKWNCIVVLKIWKSVMKKQTLAKKIPRVYIIWTYLAIFLLHIFVSNKNCSEPYRCIFEDDNSHIKI